MNRRITRRSLLGLSLLLLTAAPAFAQSTFRIANWNVTNYGTDAASTSRTSAFQTAIYGTYQGRSMSPDVLIGEEFTSQAAVNNFLNLLNTAPSSPGDWKAAAFIDGPDTDSAFFYRDSKVTYLSTKTLATNVANDPTEPPRNTYRYDIQLKDALGINPTIACYSTHMKSGSTSGTPTSDQERRQVEAQRIRADAAALPANYQFLMAGDTNIQSSSQAAYQTLTGNTANAGLFVDPINSPGSWNNNANFKYIHTQSPGGNPAQTGGMDDRLDFILLSKNMFAKQGATYVGNNALAYSTTTWNDPNHSYRAWGNDGTSFNNSLTIANNQMVGATIAQALYDSTTATDGGHLPVFLDVQVVPAPPAALVFVAGSVLFGWRLRRKRA